jgi:peptidoglycan hydrolase-like protein with peptidoglycan-binding domain
MTGNAVKQLQVALNAAHFSCGTPDGSYGPKTKDAVKRFQSVYCNPADGIYGSKTAAALNKVLN